MNDYFSEVEDESPYEYDKPATPLTFKKFSKIALGVGGAAASMALGLQVVGPALADTFGPKNPEPTSVVSNQTKVQPEVATGQTSGSSSVVQANDQVATSNKANSTAGKASLTPNSSTTTVTPNAGTSTRSTSTQVQAPTPGHAPTFANVSSATPSGGTVAKGGAGGTFTTHEAHDSEGDDHE